MERNDDWYRNLLDSLYDGVYFLDTTRRITYWNKGAERITGYARADVLGKRCSDNILNHVDDAGNPMCLIACPVQAAMDDGLPHESEVFLHHRDGHRIAVLVRTMPLRDDAGQMIGAVEVFSDNSLRVQAIERAKALESVAYLDPLTGIANRRFAEIALKSRADELARYGWMFGAIMIDVDHFKHVNDTHGHSIGDLVLQMVAKTLAGSARSFDVVGRWGGEEFIVIAPNIDAAQLTALANRLRLLVQHSNLSVNSNILRVTISIGATLARATDSPAELLRRADRLLYESKAAGRNQVSID